MVAKGVRPVDTEEFTAAGIRKLAILINCLSVIGGELLAQRSGTLKTGYANLAKFKNENKHLLEEIHALALKHNAVSALRLSEDLERGAKDAVEILSLARECLLASVFLSHCIATSGKGVSLAASGAATAEQSFH
jgi:hypothetical protein